MMSVQKSGDYRGRAGVGSLDDGREGLEQVSGALAKLGGGSRGTAEVWSTRRLSELVGEDDCSGRGDLRLRGSKPSSTYLESKIGMHGV